MSTTETITATASEPISTTLLFFHPTTPEAHTQAFYKVTPTGIETNFGFTTAPVKIQNVRGREHLYALDTHGFGWHTHATTTENLDNLRNQRNDEIKAKYYPEVEQILKDVTGAERVKIFDHTVRKRVPGAAPDGVSEDGKRQPAGRAHVDQTPWAAAQRIRENFSEEEAEDLLRRRYQIINVWRPLISPVHDRPLALADYGSCSPSDCITVELHLGNGRRGETYSVRHSEGQKWHYLSAQGTEEVTLIKCFDSKEGVAKMAPHCSFDDATAPEGVAPRESVEVRALVLY